MQIRMLIQEWADERMREAGVDPDKPGSSPDTPLELTGTEVEAMFRD